MKWDCKMRTLKGIGIVVLSLFAGHANAQLNGNYFFKELVESSQEKQGSMVWVQGNASLGSNAIDNSFGLKMGLGGHIESDRIKSIYENMNDESKVNTDLHYSVTFWGNDSLLKNGMGLYGSIGSRVYGQSTFNKDVFGVLFRGNRPYAGTNLDLSNSNASLVQYMKYTLGVHKEIIDTTTKKIKSYYGGGLSFIQGIDYLDFNTSTANLFTESNGQYVELDLQYELLRGARPKGFRNSSGAGVALDAFYGANTTKGFWEVRLSDFGMVKFNDMVRFQKDTTGVRFDGHDISANGGSLSDVLDSLVQIVDSESMEEDNTLFLPAVISARVGKMVKEDLQVDALLFYTLTANYIPLFQVRATKIKEKFSYGASLAYGGYTMTPTIGLHGTIELLDRIYLQTNLGGLESFVASNAFQGMQMHLGLGVSLH